MFVHERQTKFADVLRKNSDTLVDVALILPKRNPLLHEKIRG